MERMERLLERLLERVSCLEHRAMMADLTGAEAARPDRLYPPGVSPPRPSGDLEAITLSEAAPGASSRLEPGL